MSRSATDHPSRRRLLISAVASACLTLAPLPGPARGKQMQPIVTYISTVADDRFATQLAVMPDGRGELSIGSNRDARQRPAGLFAGPIPQPLLQRLRATLASGSFAGSADQGALVPDESYREIRAVGSGGAMVRKTIGEQISAPAEFVAAESILEEAIGHLLQLPVATLAMRVRVEPVQLRAKTPLSIEIDLLAGGAHPLTIDAPAHWGLRGTGCELSALRSDIAPQSLGLKDQRFLQLGAANFVAASPPLATPAIVLVPGRAVRLAFRVAPDWPVGRYALELSLAFSATRADAKEPLAGALVSERQQLEILA